MLEKGITGSNEITVTGENTASAWKSGNLDVFATPAMIALMEQTCAESVESRLEDGMSTVGTLVNIKHLRATPIGRRVKVESVLTEIDRRRLVFSVTATDDKGIIGEGVHERFIINCEKFLEKAMQ